MEEQTYPKVVLVTKHITPIWEDDLVKLSAYGNIIINEHCTTVAAIRNSGTFSSKGIFLSSNYDWEIVRDDAGVLVAVPQKKHEE